MSQHCYVRVNNNIKNETYDVGPFNYSGNESCFESDSAISWIYKQIGLIKIQNPEAVLIKHRWNYTNDSFWGVKADVLIEIDCFSFEIINLAYYKHHDVLSELITQIGTSTESPESI
ncbi:hypothetical protein [Serratia marcescens]|uniref:hypothetical protein n=1 Tax=Serratia marcescens TaxID=615 RepID=UPI003204AB4C|nr:hypothetical protein [Serratia marcescens]